MFSKQVQELLKKNEELFTVQDEKNASIGRMCRGRAENSGALGGKKSQVSVGMMKKAKREISVIIGPRKEFWT